MKKLLSVLLAISCFTALCGCSEQDASNPAEIPVDYWTQNKTYGLQVENGVLTLNEEPFYQIGSNCYNLFNSGLFDNYSTNLPFKALEVLDGYDVPVVRFNCGIFEGKDLRYFEGSYREETLNLLKQVAQKAEELHIGLIPSLFWNLRSVPDYLNESLLDWGNPESETRKYMREYTKDVVNALKDYKSVFGWEFTNEGNNLCDLSAEFWMSYEGMSREKAEGMLLTSDGFIDAITDFTAEVKKADTHNRMITSGNAILRPTQYFQHVNGTMGGLDTLEEHHAMNLLFHPDGMDVVSEHNYIFEYALKEQTLSLYELMKSSVETYRKNGKVYMVGEFGIVPLEVGEKDASGTTYPRIEEMFRTMMSTGVQLSFVWNYDYSNETEYSFTQNTEYGDYVLQLLKTCNAEYKDLIS
jgi:hypothetical protein